MIDIVCWTLWTRVTACAIIAVDLFALWTLLVFFLYAGVSLTLILCSAYQVPSKSTSTSVLRPIAETDTVADRGRTISLKSTSGDDVNTTEMRSAHHSLQRSPRSGAKSSAPTAPVRDSLNPSAAFNAGAQFSLDGDSSVVTWLGRYPTCHVTGITHHHNYVTQAASAAMASNGQHYELSDDFQQRQVDALERKYGGRPRTQRAATVIQRAWRSHLLAKKWRQVKDPAVRRRIPRFQTTSHLSVGYPIDPLSISPQAHPMVYASSRGDTSVPPSVLVSPRMPRHCSPLPPSAAAASLRRQITNPSGFFSPKKEQQQRTKGEIGNDTIGEMPPPFTQALNLHKYANAAGQCLEQQPLRQKLPPTAATNNNAEVRLAKVNHNSLNHFCQQPKQHPQQPLPTTSASNPASSYYSPRGPPSVSIRPSVTTPDARSTASKPIVVERNTAKYPQILSRESEVFQQSPIHRVGGEQANFQQQQIAPNSSPVMLSMPGNFSDDNYCTYIRNYISDASLGLPIRDTASGASDGSVETPTLDSPMSYGAPPPVCGHAGCLRQQQQQAMATCSSARFAAMSLARYAASPISTPNTSCYSDHNCSLASSIPSMSPTSAQSSPAQSPVWIPRQNTGGAGPRRVAVPPNSTSVGPPRVALLSKNQSMPYSTSKTAAIVKARSSAGGDQGPATNGVSSRTFETELERRRQYRIALNFFNKKPERGMQYLIGWRFVEPTPHAVAKFLTTKRGLSKQMIGDFLGNTQNRFNLAVLDCFADEIDLTGMEVDVALRKFLTWFRLPGEAQKIERVMEVFARRFFDCNPSLQSRFAGGRDTMFILAFAVVMLNTDLHSPNIKADRRMKQEDFVKNLRAVDDGHDIAEHTLIGIYQRVKEQQFRSGNDHVAQVVKVDRSIFGKKPKLPVPHRRLVCYCRLHEVADQQKKQPTNAHQREVFLFNDLIVITKILSRKKNNVTYTYRQSLSLVSMQVHPFRTNNYLYGIRIFHSLEQKTLLFNARSHEDQLKFMEDLKESIKESDEMEALRIAGEMEKQHSTLLRGATAVDLMIGVPGGVGLSRGVESQRDSGLPDLSEESSNLVKGKALSNSMLELVTASECRPSTSQQRLNGGAALSTPSGIRDRERRSSINSFDSGMSSTASVDSRESSPKTADAAAASKKSMRKSKRN